MLASGWGESVTIQDRLGDTRYYPLPVVRVPVGHGTRETWVVLSIRTKSRSDPKTVHGFNKVSIYVLEQRKLVGGGGWNSSVLHLQELTVFGLEVYLSQPYPIPVWMGGNESQD